MLKDRINPYPVNTAMLFPVLKDLRDGLTMFKNSLSSLMSGNATMPLDYLISKLENNIRTIGIQTNEEYVNRNGPVAKALRHHYKIQNKIRELESKMHSNDEIGVIGIDYEELLINLTPARYNNLADQLNRIFHPYLHEYGRFKKIYMKENMKVISYFLTQPFVNQPDHFNINAVTVGESDLSKTKINAHNSAIAHNRLNFDLIHRQDNGCVVNIKFNLSPDYVPTVQNFKVEVKHDALEEVGYIADTTFIDPDFLQSEVEKLMLAGGWDKEKYLEDSKYDHKCFLAELKKFAIENPLPDGLTEEVLRQTTRNDYRLIETYKEYYDELEEENTVKKSRVWKIVTGELCNDGVYLNIIGDFENGIVEVRERKGYWKEPIEVRFNKENNTSDIIFITPPNENNEIKELRFGPHALKYLLTLIKSYHSQVINHWNLHNEIK